MGVDNTYGTWQYSIDGSNWANIGSVSASNALLLPSDATARIRFVPNANWNGYAGQFFYKAWDRTQGTAGAYFDASVSGGATAFSGTSGSAQYVTAVNDAPTALSTNLSLGGVDEDTANPAGATVSALFSATFSDAKDQVSGGSSANNFAGVAIVANAADAGTEGKWQWHNGTSWVDISTAVSTASALTLAPTTLVRFLPNADYNGTPGSLTARLIDDSSGAVTNGSTVSVGTGGGTTRYSDASNAVVLSTSFTPVNDAPTLTSASLTVSEGQTVTVTAANFGLSDPDSSSFTFTVSALSGGYFQLSSAPGVAITSFTSAALTGGLVQFVDDGDETPRRSASPSTTAPPIPTPWPPASASPRSTTRRSLRPTTTQRTRTRLWWSAPRRLGCSTGSA